MSDSTGGCVDCLPCARKSVTGGAARHGNQWGTLSLEIRDTRLMILRFFLRSNYSFDDADYNGVLKTTNMLNLTLF